MALKITYNILLTLASILLTGRDRSLERHESALLRRHALWKARDGSQSKVLTNCQICDRLDKTFRVHDYGNEIVNLREGQLVDMLYAMRMKQLTLTHHAAR